MENINNIQVIKTKKKIVLGLLAYIFILSIGFLIGKGYQYQKYEKRVNELEEKSSFIKDFFVDSSYQYLKNHRLDIPDEISTASWYDDEEFDLLAVFIDDGGDIHLGFTGKTIKREEYLKDDDFHDFIEEHSELTSLVHK